MRAGRRRAPALHPLHLRLDGHPQGRHPHHRRLPALRARHHEVRLQPARRRRPLLHRRHRLDHGPQLHRVRPARPRRHQPPLRGSADLSGAGPLLAGRREAQGHHDLHRADRHPQPHRPGRRVADEAPHGVPAHHGLRGRAHRSQQLDVVLREGRQGPHPAERHVVADRDRRPHDRPAGRRHDPQAGFRRSSVLRRADRRAHRQGRARRRRRGRSPRHHRSVARHDPRHLGRRGRQALQGRLLLDVPGLLHHR